MNLFQFIVIISSLIFVLFAFDLYKRKKINILHILVFTIGGGLVIAFGLDTNLLNSFGSFFGFARGADLLVYISLIVLAYLYIILLNSHTKDKFNLTRLISQFAINKAYSDNKSQMLGRKNEGEKDAYVLNIRAYNEGQVIGAVIDEIVKEGFRKIVLVNDGSKDNTLEVLEQKKEQYPDCLFIIISHTINRGGGAANQSGYKFIQTYAKELQVEWFVGFDADGQMDIKDMKNFMSEIRRNGKKVDVYLGSRFVEGGSTENMPKMRNFILAVSKLVTRIFYNAKISDPHNGYRVIAIDPFQKFHLTADGMHYANEVNEQMKKHKMKYMEVPVHIKYTDYSMYSTAKGHRNRNSDSIKMAMEMIYRKIFFR